MYVDEINRIGSGKVRFVQVSIGGQLKKLRSRGGLCRGDIRIVTDGPYRGQILVPIWENIVGLAAMRDGQYDITFHDQKYLAYRMYSSIYDALRYTYHVLEGQYGITFRQGEKGKLVQARAALEEYNQAVAGVRSDNAHELSVKFYELSQQIVGNIGTDPKDKTKQEARDLSVSLATVFDTLDRVNPSAKMAVTVGAMNRLKQRMFDISCIEPHIIARRLILKSIIEEMELYLEGVYNYLSLLFHPKSDALGMLQNRQSRESINSQLGFYMQQMDRYDIAPFDRTVTHMSNEFSSARFFIKHYNSHRAVEDLRRSWNSLSLRQIRTEIEDVILQITFMLFGKPVGVDQKKCDTVISQLRKLTRRLTKVDESGFKHPVAKRVISLVRTADMSVVKKTVPELKEAKSALKQAAMLL